MCGHTIAICVVDVAEPCISIIAVLGGRHAVAVCVVTRHVRVSVVAVLVRRDAVRVLVYDGVAAVRRPFAAVVVAVDGAIAVVVDAVSALTWLVPLVVVTPLKAGAFVVFAVDKSIPVVVRTIVAVAWVIAFEEVSPKLKWSRGRKGGQRAGADG